MKYMLIMQLVGCNMGVAFKFHNRWNNSFKIKKYFAALIFWNNGPSGENSFEKDAITISKVLDTKTSNTMPLIVTTNRRPCK